MGLRVLFEGEIYSTLLLLLDVRFSDSVSFNSSVVEVQFYISTTPITLHKRTKKFTFSEPCIVIHMGEKDQQDGHFFRNNLFQLNYL